jgi:outer membrane usher protein
MRHLLRALVLLFAVVVCVAAPRIASAQDVRAILSVTVNQTDAVESLVIIRNQAKDVLVPIALLEGAGLHQLPGIPEMIDGRAFQSLAALQPNATFVLDEVALELRVRFTADFFKAHTIDLRPREPIGTWHSRNASAFANYGMNWSQGGRPSISGELGASVGTALVVTTLSRLSTGQVQRGLTTATFDQPSAMRRIALGDVAMRGGPLWSSGLMSGVAVAREFSLNPYFVRFPTPRLSQTLTTPSTVDVYVNDRLVRRTEVAPGVFDVTGIPALAGAGNARVVVRDAMGRSQEFNTQYYITSSVLSRGLHDYQYAVGYRQLAGLAGITREPAVTLTHRVGLTNAVTLGMHAEGDRTLVSGGPVMTARPGRLGEVEVALGVSRAANASAGRALSAAWAYVGRPVSLSLSVRALSAGYVSFGDVSTQSTARLDWSGAISMPAPILGALSLNVQQQWLAPTNGDAAGSWQRRVMLSGSRRLTNSAQFQWRAGRSWSRLQSGFEASIGISASFGRTVAMASVNQQSGSASGDVMVTRPLPAGTGAGYRVRGDLNGDSLDAVGEFQNHLGRAEVEMMRLNGASTMSTRVSGGIAAIGRTLALTNALGESYALVRVPGVKNVRVFSNNVEVGRTDSRGELLVPGMIPNYANRLAIADTDLPEDRMVAASEKLVAPPLRAGAVVTFAQERMQAVTGSIDWVLAGASFVPAYGLFTIKIGDRIVESPIGAQGEFFFEQVPAGQHTGTVRYRSNECTFVVTVPERTGSMMNIGKLTCKSEKN